MKVDETYVIVNEEERLPYKMTREEVRKNETSYFPLLVVFNNNERHIIEQPSHLPHGIPFKVLETRYKVIDDYEEFYRAIFDLSGSRGEKVYVGNGFTSTYHIIKNKLEGK